MLAHGRRQHPRRPTQSAAGAIPALLLPRRQPWTRFLRPLLPSFVADLVFPDHHRPAAARLHPTSYLDGLRGVAAVIVFFCHYTENNFPALIPSYGLDHKKPSSFLQLPYVRVVFSGRPMVHIFFVISGFALSYKPLRALHAREPARCHAALASSAFRRPFRLFGPCVVSTFAVLCLRQAGYMPLAQDTLGEELRKWRGALLRQIAWPWAWDRDLRPPYDIHLWTIPIEFAHSMLLFMVLLTLSRVRPRVRLAAELALVGYCLVCGKWAGFEFLAGLFLAEMHLMRPPPRARAGRAKEWEDEGGGEAEEGERGGTGGCGGGRGEDGWRLCGGAGGDSTGAWLLKTFQISLVLLGLFIAGWPNRDAHLTPGIRYFLAQTPAPFSTMDALAPQKFWFGLSAVAIVWAVGELDFLRGLFESPLAQYCGRVSFAVYICHGPVEELFKEWLLGSQAIPARGEYGTLEYEPAVPASGVKGFFGVDTPRQATVSWFVGLWLLGPLVIWVADLFWRAVDNQVVHLARKIETLCLDDSEPSPRSQGYSAAA